MNPANVKILSHREAFDEAIEAIREGARKLRSEVSKADYDLPTPDAEDAFARVPVSAYCLGLAYKVWKETNPGMPSFDPLQMALMQQAARMQQGRRPPRPAAEAMPGLRPYSHPMPPAPEEPEDLGDGPRCPE